MQRELGGLLVDWAYKHVREFEDGPSHIIINIWRPKQWSEKILRKGDVAYIAIAMINSRNTSFFPTSLSFRRARIMASISFFLASLFFSGTDPSSSISKVSLSFEFALISPICTKMARLWQALRATCRRIIREGSCEITAKMYRMIGGEYHLVRKRPSKAAMRTGV